MNVPTYFNQFLSKVRLTPNQVSDCRTGHMTLRNRLMDDDTLAPIIVNTFLQGSYRRATAVRPKDDKRADVDVIVVTKLDRSEYRNPEDALKLFEPFLEEHYAGKWEPQGRSFGIKLGYVDLDIVPTAAPSVSEYGVLAKASLADDETPDGVTNASAMPWWLSLGGDRAVHYSQSFAEAVRQDPEWKLEPLYIPDRDVKEWVPAHPLEQIRWTWNKNARCNGHYVNVVKALKWWRRVNHPTPQYPKGYPVEHIIGQNCPDGISSAAEGVTQTLENVQAAYGVYIRLNMKPYLPDHGVPQHDVLKRVAASDFALFYEQVVAAAAIARRALNETSLSRSVAAWRELFGDRFPPPPDNDDDDSGGGGGSGQGGFSRRTTVSTVTGGRFA
ncbi:SMODS domain-containing nucleotidyltransferase [Zavarzinella formosa]|uniref:SMODS domain-containing nucleotidyltransferase n=1 Tax=Zavarzinella formosa TaxID=360055 RepID=UPI0002F55E46|nr:nucleotidyltransferase [Zavarzinella formosa]